MLFRSSPDGLRVASGSDDCSVRLWDIMSGAPNMTPEGHSALVSCVAFSPDGLRVASGLNDHSVQLWDAMSGAPILTLEGHSRWISSVAFSPDGLRVASGSDDWSVRLWDTMSGAPILALEGHSSGVSSVAFSPDGLRVASGLYDCSVWLWDAMSGMPIATLRGHSNFVSFIAFSTNALILLSGTEADHTKQTCNETFGWDLTSRPPCRIHSPQVSYLSTLGLLPYIWTFDGQWVQVQRPLENHVRHICYIPSIYSTAISIEAPRLPFFSRVVIGSRSGRVIILEISRLLPI